MLTHIVESAPRWPIKACLTGNANSEWVRVLAGRAANKDADR
jgi:hypothetical protein